MRTKLVGITLICLAIGLYLGKAVPDNIHAGIRQCLLEAELGSSSTVYFALKPGASAPTDDSIDELTAKLTSAMPDVRWDAANRLAERGDPAAVDALIRAMRDPGGTIRVCIMAKALGHLKDPRALSALTEAAFDPTNRDLRLCAIQSMGMIRDPRAVPNLIKALEAGNMPLASADALARLGDERGVEPIIRAASDPKLRLWMVSSLGELGSPVAIPFLKQVANNPKKLIRKTAAEALWKIKQLSDADPVAALAQVLGSDPTMTRRMWAAFRLGELGDPESVNALIQALEDKDRGVRGRAAAALIRVGDPALQRLRKLLKQPEATSRGYVLAILGYLGTRDDLPLLRSIADNSGGKPGHIAEESTRLIENSISFDPSGIGLLSGQN